MQSSFTLLREFDIPDDGLGYDLGIDTVFVDSPLVRGKRYWYSVTSVGIPNIAILDRVTPGGGIVRDTLYSDSPESPLVENRIRVDMGFSASTGPDQVMVVPNPYRTTRTKTAGGRDAEGTGTKQRGR
jgi:hypothetical protein